MAKFHLKTVRMQRKYPRTFSPADDQDKEGFKFENVWPTFSNFGLNALKIAGCIIYFGSTFRLRITINISLNWRFRN